MARTRSPHLDPFPDLSPVIDRHGFAVVAVGYGGCSTPGCCGPSSATPWIYTVGLERIGHPELVLLGLDLDTAHAAVDEIGRQVLLGLTLPTDEGFDWSGHRLKLVDVPDEWILSDADRMAGWFEFHERTGGIGGLPKVRQVVWADAAGRFPDDPRGPAIGHELQPVLRDDPISLPHRRAARRTRHLKSA